jgi:NADH:ubiquinone oxidoreductase subunit E
MPILQKTQEAYGYLPFELQNVIAEELDISVSEVYDVATFYSQFTLKKKGKYKIGVCMGTACYVKNSQGFGSAQQGLNIPVGERPLPISNLRWKPPDAWDAAVWLRSS